MQPQSCLFGDTCFAPNVIVVLILYRGEARILRGGENIRGRAVFVHGQQRCLELPRGVSLTLHRGEILGIAGIIGAGRTELLRAVFGLDPVRRGRVVVKSMEGGRAGPRFLA